MPWHCTVTDEGSPPKAGLTAVRTLAILRLAAEPPQLPLRRELSAKLTEGLYLRPEIAFTPNFDSKIKSVRFTAEPRSER